MFDQGRTGEAALFLSLFVFAGVADLLPVPLGVRVCGGKAEGCGEAGGEAEAERCQETGEVDRKSKCFFFPYLFWTS